MTAPNVRPVPARSSARPAPAPTEASFDAPAPPEEVLPKQEDGPPGPPPKGPRNGGGGNGDFGGVVPIGTESSGGKLSFVLLDVHGTRHVLAPHHIMAGAYIEALFGGEDGVPFLVSRWPHLVPKRGKDGRPLRDDDGEVEMQVSGFSAKKVGSALIAACGRLGIAGRVQERLDGVWPAEGGRSLIVHSGRRVAVQDADVPEQWMEHAAGLRLGKHVYLAAASRDEPARQAATVAEVAKVMADFQLWTYAGEHDALAPALLLGMVGVGLAPAALPFRPALYLYGLRGSGKSALQMLVCRLVGADKPKDGFTEPGVRRDYNARSTLIALNEAESQNPAMSRMLDLVVQASDGDGASIVMAGEGDKPMLFHVNGAFLFAAITPPHFSPAQASRIALIRVAREHKHGKEAVEAAIARAGAMAPRLLKRMVDGWARLRENLAVLRKAAIGAGATSRSADCIGVLLAASQTLQHDTAIEPAAAAELVDAYRDFFQTEAQTDEQDGGQVALQHLLASRVPIGRDETSVAAALAELRGAVREAATARAELRQGKRDASVVADCEHREKIWLKRAGPLGLRWVEGLTPRQMGHDGPDGMEIPAPGVLVKNGAPVIEKAFAGTEFKGFAWQNLFRSLPGAVELKTSVKFAAGGQGRCVWLPESLLALDDD